VKKTVSLATSGGGSYAVRGGASRRDGRVPQLLTLWLTPKPPHRKWSGRQLYWIWYKIPTEPFPSLSIWPSLLPHIVPHLSASLCFPKDSCLSGSRGTWEMTTPLILISFTRCMSTCLYEGTELVQHTSRLKKILWILGLSIKWKHVRRLLSVWMSARFMPKITGGSIL
jgi:hypothetical protein